MLKKFEAVVCCLSVGYGSWIPNQLAVKAEAMVCYLSVGNGSCVTNQGMGVGWVREI
jgi:hypothetical protein